MTLRHKMMSLRRGRNSVLRLWKSNWTSSFSWVLDGVLVAHFFEIAQAAGVIHRLHLGIGVAAFLAGAEAGIADVGSHDLQFPRRRNQRLGRGHFKRQRIAQIVVGERVADQHGDGVRFLACGTSGAPDAKVKIAALLLAAEDFFEHGFLQQIELRAIAKKTGFVDGQIFEQQREFGSAFAAGQQAVVSVKRIELTDFEAALQTILQKMRAAFVKEHAAFLIDERLQQL